jgi:hypothetical protein
MVIWYIYMLALFFIPAVLVWGGVWFLVRRLSIVLRIISLVLTATLLFTPSWGPATITAVPVPFGFLLGAALFSGAWSEIIGMVTMFPVWHAVAFPATAAVFYLIVRRLLSNKPSQPIAPTNGAPAER